MLVGTYLAVCNLFVCNTVDTLEATLYIHPQVGPTLLSAPLARRLPNRRALAGQPLPDASEVKRCTTGRTQLSARSYRDSSCASAVIGAVVQTSFKNC